MKPVADPVGFDALVFNGRHGRLVCVYGADEDGWEHVSVSPYESVHETRCPCPTWGQMADVKRLFWRDDETVVQIHPSEDEYFHGPGFDTNILHLWRPSDGDWSRLEETAEEVCQNPAKIDPFWDEFGSELTRDDGGFPGGPGEPRGV